LAIINRRIDNGGATAISAFKSIRLNHINQRGISTFTKVLAKRFEFNRNTIAKI
jgi:hypothetical protein